MKYNKSISTFEIMEKYPCGSMFIPIDELSLECINKALQKDYNTTIETLDVDYVHVYKNRIIVLTKSNNEISILVFTEKEKVSDEVIQARRKLFFELFEEL